MRMSYGTVSRGWARYSGPACVGKAKTDNGPSGRAPLLSDAEILELRALSQFASWSRDRLMRRYSIDAVTCDRYLSGITRSRLVAKPCHLPAEALQ